MEITREEFEKAMRAEAEFEAEFETQDCAHPGDPGYKKLTESSSITEREMAQAKEANHLADEHWEWIKKLLDTQLLVTERLFKNGIKHGWTHAKEKRKNF